MSRDTRLDALIADLAAKAQRLDKCSDGELFVAGKAYDAARRAIEELFGSLRERNRELVAELQAADPSWTDMPAFDDVAAIDHPASLSVSPVPSEPTDKHECEWCCSRNWTWHNVAAGRCSECTPAADSPVPEPSEPPCDACCGSGVQARSRGDTSGWGTYTQWDTCTKCEGTGRAAGDTPK